MGVLSVLLVGSARAEVFTLAALPDTQSYVKSDALNLGFEAQTQWLADNAALSNIVFVTHLGDMVSDGGESVTEGVTAYTNNEAQWTRATRAMATLDAAGVLWNTAVGNHELDQVDTVNSGYTQWKTNFGASTTGRFDAMAGVHPETRLRKQLVVP